jgi:WD40 repeat protein
MAEYKEAQEALKKDEDKRQYVSQLLSKRVVANTAYSDQGKHPCDSGTRVDILSDVQKWASDISAGAQNVLWLTGRPGCGKSAITASIAQYCEDEGILRAQFFINRNLSNTTNPASYLPSIVRQLIDHFPEIAVALHDDLKEKPSLIYNASQLQAEKLFVKSLKLASSIDSSKPVVVIIDGLDETDPTHLSSTVGILSRALVGLPKNAKVFVSSRTDDEIRKALSATFHKKIYLDTAAESSIGDVSTYLRKKIATIAQRHNLDSLQWPGEERMGILCDRASGLFIWAATAVKFIQIQLDFYGKERLISVFDQLNIEGMEDINVLYSKVLDLTYGGETDPWRFRRIVGCIVVLREALCLADITPLLDLRETTTSDPVDMEHHVTRLRTVLVAGIERISGRTVPRLHSSFSEFITSVRAEPHFHITLDMSRGEVTMQCLRQLVSYVNDTTANHSMTGAFRYACEFWTSHPPSGMSTGTSAGVVVAGSLKCPDLHELVRYSFREGGQPPCVHVTSSFSSSGRRQIFSSSEQSICLWDGNSGSPIQFPIICRAANGVHSVAFSSDGKKIISGSGDGTLRLWDARSGQPIGSPFEGHVGGVLSVAFSRDGKHIISGSEDGKLRLWDAQGDNHMGLPLQGHTKVVFSVAFSPNGEKIISGSGDSTLRLWDTQKRQPIGSPFKGHDSGVYSVAFSPDGNQVISGSKDATLRLWDVHNGQPIGTPFRGHTEGIYSVAFSPDGSQIISGSMDKTIRLWNARDGRAIGSPFWGHESHVRSVAFSSDGKQIISGSWDSSIRLWDLDNGQSFTFSGHKDLVLSVAISPKEPKIVSGSKDDTIRIWDAKNLQPIEFPYSDNTDNFTHRVTSFALSPDNKNIVSASSDDTVRMWNVQTGQPIGLPLRGDIKNVVSLIFSPDGSQFAAASSDSTVCLWTTKSRILLASYRKDCIREMQFINFSTDGKNLLTCFIDGTTQIWNARSGQLINPSESPGLPLSKSSNFMVFSMERGWCHEETDDVLLRWYPVNNPDFGYWAYVDETLIRRDRTGLTTIMDMRELVRKWRDGVDQRSVEEERT